MPKREALVQKLCASSACSAVVRLRPKVVQAGSQVLPQCRNMVACGCIIRACMDFLESLEHGLTPEILFREIYFLEGMMVTVQDGLGVAPLRPPPPKTPCWWNPRNTPLTPL